MKKQASSKLVVVSLLATLAIVLVVYYRYFVTEPEPITQGVMGSGPGGPPPAPPSGLEAVEVTTLAGRPSPGYVDAAGLQARFDGPAGLAWDGRGGVYVADSRNHRIRHISPEGQVTTVAGSGPEGSVQGGYGDGPAREARFWNPSGLAVDRSGFIYVADSGNHCLRRISPAGEVTTVAGLPGPPHPKTGFREGGYQDGPARQARFRSPGGLAFDAFGNLYIADVGNHCIRCLRPSGEVVTIAGRPGKPGPMGLLLGAYADGAADQARFRSPVALTCSPEGNLYVTDEGNSCVRVVTPEGAVSSLPVRHRAPPSGSNDWTAPEPDPAGRPAPQGPRLLQPAGIALDLQGQLLVSDAYVNCLFRLHPAGTLSLLAGVFHEGEPHSNWGDGPGTRCSFARPVALAWAPDGVLYVADFGNNCVRRVTIPREEGPGV